MGAIGHFERLGRTFATAMALAALLLLPGPGPAAADTIEDCFGDGSSRRIEGCTELLEMPGLNPTDKSLAYAMRALGYSLKGQHDLALPDYDMAISLDPQSAIALNNRAWTLFRAGTPEKGLADVERSLTLMPGSAHAHDTRGHIFQATGEPQKAIRDYIAAMRFGGERIIKLYQCGLMTAGLYKGEISGLFTSDLRRALETCVYRLGCDPLPPDEDCRYTTS
ncbi:MAG: tetratricopeptide repeat protein [Hyphomicrobium sp.]